MASKNHKSNDLLDKITKNLQNKFGEDFVTIHTNITDPPRLSTGVLSLDKALGGGIVYGRCTELFGKSSVGKTTVALYILKAAQEIDKSKWVVYIDAEHALSIEWVAKLGLDMPRFLHIQPETLEQAFVALEGYLETGIVNAMVFDSIPAGVPQRIMEGDIGEANIGIHARIISQTLPRIATKLSRAEEPPALIFINQKRAEINTGGYGPTTKATGGFAFPYYMSTRLEVKRIGSLKDNPHGQQVQVDVVKHKYNPGHGAKITFEIDNTIGIDTDKELLDMALESGEIIQSGSWFVLGDGTKVQGAEQAKEWIREQRKLQTKTELTKST